MASMRINFDAIPEYREAVERESFVRDAAFAGELESICGISVLPLTFRHWLWLTIIESPFIGHRDVDLAKLPGDIGAVFLTLWRGRQRPRNGSLGYALREKLFLMRVGRLKSDKAIEGIMNFIHSAFMDSPCGGSGESVSYFSFGAAIVHRFCQVYSITPDDALDMPVKQGFQLLKIIEREEMAKIGKRKALFNPSDSLRGRLAKKIFEDPNCDEAKAAKLN